MKKVLQPLDRLIKNCACLKKRSVITNDWLDTKVSHDDKLDWVSDQTYLRHNTFETSASSNKIALFTP